MVPSAGGPRGDPSLGGLPCLLGTLLEEEKSALAEALKAATDGCAACVYMHISTCTPWLWMQSAWRGGLGAWPSMAALCAVQQ